jgi:ABC-type branched-subunit amino acid transport system substrate-binding protein
MSPYALRPHLLVVAGVLAFATACGSTVQVSSTVPSGAGMGAAGPTDDGLARYSPSPGGSPAAGPTARVGTPQAPAQQPLGSSGKAGTGELSGSLGSGAVSMPGVTATTITVGVIAADPSTDQTFENMGFGAASLGNEPANWRAMVDDINGRGGIAGRRLALVFYLVNLTDSPSVQGQAACTRFTQDNKVAAVLSGYYYAPADTCLSQHGVPALLGTNYGVDRQAAAGTRSVLAWATPLLDRLASLLPDAFQKMGKLKAGTTAGIFVTDAAPFMRSASQLSSELTRRGLKVVTGTVRDSDTGDYTGMASDASAAELRFWQAGVTEVLFLTHNAAEPTLLMQAANSQNYHPTYLLSTQQYPATLIGLAPAGQLKGALAVGWAPAIDLSSGYDASTRAQQCLSTLRKHGRTYSSGTQTLAGLLACDGVDLLERAAEQRGGLASRDALLLSAHSAATGFASAVTFTTNFSGGRPDGVDAYRAMAFSSGCDCFSYTGPVTHM